MMQPRPGIQAPPVPYGRPPMGPPGQGVSYLIIIRIMNVNEKRILGVG